MPPAANRTITRSRLEAERSRRVLRIAKEASATLGSEFFQSLARHLLTALDSDYVYIGELSRAPAGRLRTLAACKKPGELDGFEQDLAGTASEQVLTDGAYSCSRGVTQIFPLATHSPISTFLPGGMALAVSTRHPPRLTLAKLPHIGASSSSTRNSTATKHLIRG